MPLDAFPKIVRVFFAEEHDCLAGPIAKEVCLQPPVSRKNQAEQSGNPHLLDVVGEEVSKMLLFGIEPH